MRQYAYSPDTGELIQTDTPADWMGITDLIPPTFDLTKDGCFFRNGAWVIIAGESPTGGAPTEADYIAAIQSKLDSTAKQYGYDSILSAVTYADDPTVPLFQHQGQAFRAWRSQIWAWGYALLAQVKSGAVQQPTVTELVAQMPSITVPTA